MSRAHRGITTAWISLLVTSFFLLLPATAFGQTDAALGLLESLVGRGGKGEARTIVVVGHGEVAVAPDLAVVTAAVETTSPSAREAVATNAEKSSIVLERIKELLRETDSIRTTNFSLQPRYARRGPDLAKITGYVARNEVRVEIRNLEVVGQILDAAIEAGANRASGLRFLREDRSPLREALAKAGAEARAQAETIASALGVRLGKVLHATTSFATPRPIYQQLRASAAAATPVEAGELTLSATLHVTFAIE